MKNIKITLKNKVEDWQELLLSRDLCIVIYL